MPDSGTNCNLAKNDSKIMLKVRAEASTLKIGWICLQSDVKGSVRMRAHCKLAGKSTTVMLKDA